MERSLTLIALFAALVAILGLVPQISLAAGVPITAQSLGIMLCGTVLGARRVALAAGLPERVAGLTIDRQCAGGLDAIGLAAALVDGGRARVVVAGGVESYSRRPLRAMPGPDGAPAFYDQAPFTPWPARWPRSCRHDGWRWPSRW